MKELLIKLNACKEAREWASNKSWEEIYNTCERGDWLIWLFSKTNPNDLQLLSLVKGHCANTVRHLMIDERSIKAVDTAIAIGEGKFTKDELDDKIIVDATAAIYTVDGIDYAAIAAVISISDSIDYIAAAAASTAYINNIISITDANKAWKTHQQLTADICRKYLPIEVWNIK